MALVEFQFVIASNNTHKVVEIRELAPKGFVFKSLSDIDFTDELEETLGTIEGNALQKARKLWQLTGFNCVADDSGLIIEALNGEPGVDSAVYAGEPKNDQNNIEKVLFLMKDISARNAYFVTILALIIDGKEFLFEGRIDGTITTSQRGTNGFGYDSIFIPENTNLTFAEMSSEEKNANSHRSRAVQKMIEFIIQYAKKESTS
jgi:XTP/dITP diphosphohydrolase